MAKEKGLLIAMADGNINDHEKVKTAARDCNVNHVFTSLYNGMQLMDLLMNRGVYSGGSHRNPDVIIMDIHLDLIDGFDALIQIKQHPKTKDIPVYILTKDRRDDEVEKALAIGAKDYFEKPLKEGELGKIIHRICEVNFLY